MWQWRTVCALAETATCVDAEQAGSRSRARESGYSVSTTSRPACLQPRDKGLAACDRIVVVGRAVEDADRARRRRRCRSDRSSSNPDRTECSLRTARRTCSRACGSGRGSHRARPVRRAKIPSARCGRGRRADVSPGSPASDRCRRCRLSRPSSAWLVPITVRPRPVKAVDHEGRNAHGIELVHPGFAGAADAARAVHHHHDGEAAGALRDAKFAGDRDRLAVGIAGQELLVGEGERRDRVDLDARGRLPSAPIARWFRCR